MAFNLGPIVIDRIVEGIAEDFNGNLLYRLTQLSEGTIETTADTRDAVDAQGTLIKRFYQTKAVSFSATNALLDLDVLGVTTGSSKEVATSDATIQAPRILVVKGSEKTVTLPNTPIAGTVTVAKLAPNGSFEVQYKLGTPASATDYALSETTLTLPTGLADADQIMIKYDYLSESAVRVSQKADKFPGTVKMTLTVLIADPCSVDTMRHAYVIFPSLQVSPETTVTMTTDGNFDFQGEAQVDYCSPDKELYYIVAPDDDVEE